MIQRKSAIKTREGFTLVELAVVIVIIGVLAAFGVPKFLNSVERAKASEAIAYLSAIQSSQERYIAQQGVYATDPTTLDISIIPPTYFTAGTITTTNTGTNPTWSMTLTRIASSSSKGAYTVTFTQNGFDTANSTIMNVPEVNPFGSNTTNGGNGTTGTTG